MKLVEIIEDRHADWAVVETKGKLVTFTLNDDRSFYILNQNGGAMQDSEIAWRDQATSEDLDDLRNLSLILKQELEAQIEHSKEATN